MARARIARHETNGRPPSLDLSYAAFRERLRSIGPALVANALDGEEMFNPDLEALVDQVKDEVTGEVENLEVLQALQDHAKDRETVSDLLKDYLQHNPKRSSRTVAANDDTTVRLWIADTATGLFTGSRGLRRWSGLRASRMGRPGTPSSGTRP